MTADDYSSPQFQSRVRRLVRRLGHCWDNDPRVAFVELGIFGKWGEQHSPYPTEKMQAVVGQAFAEAFTNKLVSVRRNWERFQEQPFGEYWDSWAHYDQMWSHGNSIAELNARTERYKVNYIGGETAYGWGNSKVQPGPTPTDSVAKANHREFIINTIRWLHCTQLRWIEDYDQTNPEAVQGAEEIQKAFGYRFILKEVTFTTHGPLKVSFKVANEGSAPFYYDWPVEVALLDVRSREPVWQAIFKDADIRKWMPGQGWAPPDWLVAKKGWVRFHPNNNWSRTKPGWSEPPAANEVSGRFQVSAPKGKYLLTLAILDPAGNRPSLRFATANYLNGGRHPIGMFVVGEGRGGPLAPDFRFDDPFKDQTLRYTTWPTP
jgi:hypothetical protein